MPPTPKVTPTNTASVAQSANNRLNALVPNMASPDSPSTVWTTSLVTELIAAETPPTNTYGTLPGGTWTCPAGISQVQVELWGGGGGGGGGGVTGQGGGGGGGGGEYAAEPAYPVVPGEQYAYSCGDGGTGGVTSNPGTDGQKTIFDLQGVGLAGGITANGGKGGDKAGRGKGGAGGTGSTNTIHYDGGAGGSNATGAGDDIPWDAPVSLKVMYWYIMDDDPAVVTNNTITDSTGFTVATPNWISPLNIPTTNVPNTVILGGTSPAAPVQAPTTSSIPGQIYQACAFFDYTAPSSTKTPYYRLNNAKLSTTAVTVSVWVNNSGGNYSGNNSQSGTIVSTFNIFGTIASPGYALWVDSSNVAHFKIVRPNGSGGWNTVNSITLQLDTVSWNYIVASYDGTTMRMYVYNSTNPSGLSTSGAGPSGSGSAVQVNSNSTWIGVSPANSGTNNGFSGYMSNLWMATAAITSTTWPNSVYNPTTPSTTGCGGGASGGGGGIGGTGGTGGSGGNGGLPPAVANGSTLTQGQAGLAGGLLSSNGATPSSDTWSGGGGGAGELPASAPTLHSFTVTAAQSASYAGPDAVDNPSSMYTYSLSPLVTNPDEKQFTSNANLSPDCYQGGQQNLDGNYQGTMSSAMLLSNPAGTSAALTGQSITALILSLEILSPNASSLSLSYTSDTSLGGTFTASSLNFVTTLPIPAGSQNTVLSWDLTEHTNLGTALRNGTATCLVFGPGNTPGDADYTSTTTAQQFSVSFIGAGGVAAGYTQDAMLSITYTTSGYSFGSQGLPGQIQITYVNPTGTPVAAMQPYATTDSQGNAYAAGFTGPITTWQPASSPLVLETWHKPASLSNGWAQGVPGFQYKLLPENAIAICGTIDPTSMSNTTFYTLPSGYIPLNQAIDFPVAFHGTGVPSNVFGRLHTDGTIAIINANTGTGIMAINTRIPLDIV